MQERTETQRANIKRWLEEGKSITPIEALNMWGCFRLGAHIFVLKNDYGMDIVSELIFEPKGKRYAKYYLRKENSTE